VSYLIGFVARSTTERRCTKIFRRYSLPRDVLELLGTLAHAPTSLSTSNWRRSVIAKYARVLARNLLYINSFFHSRLMFDSFWLKIVYVTLKLSFIITLIRVWNMHANINYAK
jgi:hypothetical protein